ncbi:MAG: caspase family protein [Elusimicrobia bacterium]|nr:caspase family protein [Elusimicrobiota bacterium]
MRAVLLWAAMLAPLCASAGGRVYTMSPTAYSQQLNWQNFQYRHDAEVANERATIERANLQALSVMPLQPAVYSSAESSYRQPPPVWRGPQYPPEMREFKDEFHRVVTEYVRAHSRGGKGSFEVEDKGTGRRYQLRLVSIHTERIRKLGPDSTVGCADFETVSEPTQTLDLDFFLSNDDWSWEVKKVLVHGINGSLRYAYDSADRIVTPRPAAPSPRPVPRPQAPARLSAQVAVEDLSGDGVVEAGESARLSVKLRNAGPGPAYALRLALEALSGAEALSLPGAVELGNLPANQSLEKEVRLEVSESAAPQKVRLRLAIREGNGFDTEPAVIEFQTRFSRPPILEVSDISVGGTGIVTAGEATQVSVRIRNRGSGTARGVVAALELGSKDIFMSGEPSVPLDAIAPGRSKEAAFEFFANRRFKTGDTLPVGLTLTEATGKRGVASFPLKLVLGRSAPSVTVVAMKEPSRPEASEEPSAESESVDVPPRTRTPRDPEAYAVVVGIEKYRDIPAADFAARDAGVVYAYLTQAMGFDPKNVVLLQDGRATLTDLATYLGPWLKDRATAKSKVFVYFAGHGAPDPRTGQAYLIPYDGDPAYPDTKAFPLQKLYDALGQLPTDDVVVALDSCFSGAGGRSVLAKGTRPLVTADQGARLSSNVVLLAAAGKDQISADDPDARHGLLTYFMLKGLRGEAAGPGGRVTTRELFTYLKPAVEREARKRHVEQTPVLSPSLERLGKRGSRVWLTTK